MACYKIFPALQLPLLWMASASTPAGYDWCLAQTSKVIRPGECIAMKSSADTDLIAAEALCMADGGQLPVVIEQNHRNELAGLISDAQNPIVKEPMSSEWVCVDGSQKGRVVASEPSRGSRGLVLEGWKAADGRRTYWGVHKLHWGSGRPFTITGHQYLALEHTGTHWDNKWDTPSSHSQVACQYFQHKVDANTGYNWCMAQPTHVERGDECIAAKSGTGNIQFAEEARFCSPCSAPFYLGNRGGGRFSAVDAKREYSRCAWPTTDSFQ